MDTKCNSVYTIVMMCSTYVTWNKDCSGTKKGKGYAKCPNYGMIAVGFYSLPY